MDDSWMTWGKSKKMAMKKSYGLTRPICTASPNHSDILLNNKLTKFLQEETFETDEEVHKRAGVVIKLRNLIKKWIIDVSRNDKRISPKMVESVGGTVRKLGSFQLGVAGKGAAIDILCAEQNALVPLITVKINGISVQMFFARLSQNKVPDNIDLTNDNILKDLDERCFRSLNGYRVADQILRQVPKRDTFMLALRAIKLWAKGKLVTVFTAFLSGYLSGIPWAILVAKTCQLYPNAAASTIVEKFFFVFANWAFPQPIHLKRPHDAKLNFRVWDSRVHRNHRMPIITPVYPHENSIYNITKRSKELLLEAFRDGYENIQKIREERSSWEHFFNIPKQSEQEGHPLKSHQEIEQDHPLKSHQETEQEDYQLKSHQETEQDLPLKSHQETEHGHALNSHQETEQDLPLTSHQETEQESYPLKSHQETEQEHPLKSHQETEKEHHPFKSHQETEHGHALKSQHETKQDLPLKSQQETEQEDHPLKSHQETEQEHHPLKSHHETVQQHHPLKSHQETEQEHPHSSLINRDPTK
ncbi:Poly(A) polymerase gamma [Armadillidium vulgare]|nr:Poly(A) polymerase gamma [Armadillidium vulgare]